jgi:hypothetical protein
MSLSRKEQNRAFKKNIIYGSRLAEKWGVDPHELSYVILKQNLSILDLPSRFNRDSKYDPNYYKIDSEKLLEIILDDPRSLKDEAFWLPEIQKATNYVSSLPRKDRRIPNWPFELKYKLVFSKDGRPLKENKTKAHPKKTQKKPRDILKNIIEEQESDIKKNPNVFSLIGKVWFVKYKNQEWGLFPDLEKYKYISCLLELTKLYSKSLEYSIYNSDLIAKIKGISISHENDNQGFKEDLTESDLAKDLTPDEFKRFKDIGYGLLEDLNEAKEAGDPIKVKEAEKILNTYQSYILNDYGIKCHISKDGLKISFGTYYRSSMESEKLRQLIKNQINNAIKDFKKSMPTLGIHLKNCLSTKLNKTLYTPEGIQWQV